MTTVELEAWWRDQSLSQFILARMLLLGQLGHNSHVDIECFLVLGAALLTMVDNVRKEDT